MALFLSLLSNSSFNRRRRALSWIIEEIRRVLSNALIDPEDEIRLVDSAPIPVCTYGRSEACVTVQGVEYAGWMASRKALVYGLRVSLTTTTDQGFDQRLLAPASQHDSRTGQQLLEAANGIYALGDSAYDSPWIAAPLAQQSRNHQNQE